jgi:hypothetical protein
MNVKVFLAAIIFASSFVFTSCDDDDDDDIARPEVLLHELGIGNSKVGYVGKDLHIEADVKAVGKFDYAIVKILSKDKNSTIADSTFKNTEYKGKINPTFHRHLDIPEDVDPGDYVFQLTVFDEAGQQTTIEENLKIEIINDNEKPVISITSSPENKEYATGAEITISGTVTDDQSLKGLYIGLVRNNQNLGDEEVGHSNTISLLHTHHFEDSKSHDFNATIKVGASEDNDMDPKPIEGGIAWQSGDYYIVVKAKDAADNWAFSDHYPVTVKLSE